VDDARIRVGDDDRDAVAAQLREHFAAGRLTDDELHERLDATYRARTFGDLNPVLADLPRLDGPSALATPGPTSPARAPTPAPAPTSGAGGPAPARWRSRRAVALRAGWAAWLAAVSISLVVWLLVSVSDGDEGFAYFWPMWVAGPWGAVLLASTVAHFAVPDRDEDGPTGPRG
jgi:Domain of unknown function (DUF1707)